MQVHNTCSIKYIPGTGKVFAQGDLYLPGSLGCILRSDQDALGTTSQTPIHEENLIPKVQYLVCLSLRYYCNLYRGTVGIRRRCSVHCNHCNQCTALPQAAQVPVARCGKRSDQLRHVRALCCSKLPCLFAAKLIDRAWGRPARFRASLPKSTQV